MRRLLLLVFLATSTLGGGVFAYRFVDACADWQDRYKRVLFDELMGRSPLILTPDKIEAEIGERPPGCDRPDRALGEADLRRFHEEYAGRLGKSQD